LAGYPHKKDDMRFCGMGQGREVATYFPFGPIPMAGAKGKMGRSLGLADTLPGIVFSNGQPIDPLLAVVGDALPNRGFPILARL